MTAAVDAPAAVSAADIEDRTARGAARRALPWLVVLLVAVVALGLIGLLNPPKATDLDPQSPKAFGAQALARVLGQHGVDVDVVRSVGALRDTAPAPGTTVLVDRPNDLPSGTAARAARVAGPGSRLVLLAPTTATLRAMGIDATSTVQWSDEPVRADCTSTIAHPDDELVGGSRGFRATAAAGSVTRCFASGASDGPAPLVVIERPGRAEVVLLGWTRELDNGHITAHDTAGVAVRALGSTPRLVWYHPGPADLAEAATAGRRGLVLPAWLQPLAVVLGTGVALLALVRGRRLGRLVPEPLPVVVRAVETTESRGRLYRRAADRSRTAEILRRGTRARLGRSLGVARTADAGDVSDVGALVPAVSGSVGLAEPEVRALLAGPAPVTDADLTRLAQQLAELEEKVRVR